MRLSTIPQIYRHMNRWREILAVLSKYGLANWISRLGLRFANGFLKNRDGEALAVASRETRIRLALEELGPTFIKLGQILSTRPDLVGAELADELRKLQDNTRCDSPEAVRRTIESELNLPLEDCFAVFNLAPLASASIGQVHKARMNDGRRAVVKVQHEGIQQRIRVDLDIMSGLAQLAEMLPELACYRPTSIVEEFKRTICRELDFEREQRNLMQFGAAFADDETVRIPQTYPQLCTSRVLTMERLEGIKLSEFDPCVCTRLDPQELARRGAHLYLEMIFSHGHYHADPHPGNLVLMDNNVVGLMDFGMVARIDQPLREEIEEMLMAMVDRDPYYLTSIIMRLGATPADLDEAMLTVDMADFVDHYSNQPMEAFDLGGALQEMVAVIRRYNITLPAPMAMLIKVLIMLEGTGRLLSPKFALMEVMQPYRKQMLLRRLSPARQWKRLRRVAHDVERLVEVLPRRMLDILHQVQSGRFDVHLDHRGLEPSVNRLVLGMLASALFLGSSILLSRDVPPKLYGISILGACGCLLSLALGLRLLRAISKSGHLDRRK